MTDNDSSTENSIPNQVTIAYFILVHRFPEQFKRLFKALYHPENHYLIHLDKKTSIELYDDIKDFFTDFPNTYILESENVVWGRLQYGSSRTQWNELLVEIKCSVGFLY